MANPNTPPSFGEDDQNGTPPPADLKTVQSDANAALDEARSVAGDVAAEVTAQAQQLGEQAKSQIADATARAKDAVSSQKDILADQVGGVADAIGSVADELDNKGNATSHYARMLADNAGKFSDTIRNNDVDALLGMANDFGRRQPVAFIGMAALLGFAASRFLVASANRAQNMPVDGTSMRSGTAMTTSSVADASDSYQAGGL
jgi:ElaB/YqjD/DUF883 family membrane-anchored ribosome-binding protein